MVLIDMAFYEAGVKKLVDILYKDIIEELISVMKERLIPAISSNLMRVYDEEIASRAPDYDPANPASPEVRGAFQASIMRTLTETLMSNKDTVSISTGDMDELGYGHHSLAYLKDGVGSNPSPLSWLVFYLEGFIGSYYFITKEDYQELNRAGKVSETSLEKFSSWGWYGNGFLVSTAAYRARKFDQVTEVKPKLHPFSGMRPSNLFDHALDGVDFDGMVDEAISRALGSMK